MQSTLDALVPLLDPDDVVIDGGNSYYRDDMSRAQALRRARIHYVDVGTSDGIWGLERGFCLMIGGETEVVRGLDPIFKTLAPGRASASPTPSRTRTDGTAPDGYLHCGPNGAGQFVKMVHNGVEYGMMASIAEGLSIIKHANAGRETRVADAETTPLRDPEAYQYDIDVAEVAEVWRRGSVVGSWLVDLTADAFARSRGLDDLTGRVSDSGEGRWTVLAAVEEGVPATTIATALLQRFESRGLGEFTARSSRPCAANSAATPRRSSRLASTCRRQRARLRMHRPRRSCTSQDPGARPARTGCSPATRVGVTRGCAPGRDGRHQREAAVGPAKSSSRSASTSGADRNGQCPVPSSRMPALSDSRATWPPHVPLMTWS